jgi:hypothetical protein
MELTTMEMSNRHVIQKIIWNKTIPLKASNFVWRLISYRIPTKENLLKCGILRPNMNACVVGCGYAENIDHLFLACKFFRSIWLLVRQWKGII